MPSREVLDCASPLARFDVVALTESARGLAQSKTLARSSEALSAAVRWYRGWSRVAGLGGADLESARGLAQSKTLARRLQALTAPVRWYRG